MIHARAVAAKSIRSVMENEIKKKYIYTGVLKKYKGNPM